MTAGAVVVVIQSADRVEEQQPAEIDKLLVQPATESWFECCFDASGETVLGEH